MKTLYLVRGIPGSGKSTFARSLGFKHHFEADMFFLDERGNYKFDASKIKKAHEWCQSKFLAALSSGENIVVSNTFIRKWEMEFYKQKAEEFGYKVIVKTMTGNYENIHGVPSWKIEQMKNNFEE